MSHQPGVPDGAVAGDCAGGRFDRASDNGRRCVAGEGGSDGYGCVTGGEHYLLEHREKNTDEKEYQHQRKECCIITVAFGIVPLFAK